jgi:hypothetical protein
MKKSLLLLSILTGFSLVATAQTRPQKLAQRIEVIEDKLAIKNVLDRFSALADTKEIDEQVLLFTEDGVVESISKGMPSSKLVGRQQLKEVFSRFLAGFSTVYHQNGQQTIDLQGDKASATSYCTVILVGEQEGKTMKTTLYTIYQDEFVKFNGQWLIKHRTSNFVWREVKEVN